MNGIININKPAGWTSQDVCSKLRHVLKTKKIGHTGTLDPMATGVLPVCMGNATRIIEYYDADMKSYHAAMQLGTVTDTLDITGEVLETHDWSNVTEEAVREAFKAYTGHIGQVPPKYSALKVDGKRAYDLAREGKDFELKKRYIDISRNEISFLDLERGIIEFDVTCSKGTYIRTICDDIGRTLGCGAAMTALTRTASGYFKIEDSHTIEEVIAAVEADRQAETEADTAVEADRQAATEADNAAGSVGSLASEEGSASVNCKRGISEVDKMLIQADVTLKNLGVIVLNNNRVTAFLNGNSSWGGNFRIRQQSEFNNIYRVYAQPADYRSDSNKNNSQIVGNLQFLGTATVENGSLIPQKVIN